MVEDEDNAAREEPAVAFTADQSACFEDLERRGWEEHD